MSELVLEYYRADGIETDRNHGYVAVFIRLDHQVAAAELLEDAIVGTIA
jgi:hypothetical protein